MKIIFCDNTLWGLVNFRGEVIKHFVHKGYEVILAAPEKEDDQMQTTIPEGVRYIPVDMGRTSRNPFNDVKYFLRIWKIFRRERPDYVFNYTIKPNIYGSIAAKLTGSHSTAMMAGLGYVFINDTLVTRFARQLYRMGLRFTDNLLLLNTHNQELAAKLKMCDLRKMVLLKGGEGINIDKFRFYDNAADKVTFLYVGRMSWDKGYGEMVEATRIVKKVYPEVCVELLGSLDPSYPNNVPAEKVKADESEGLVKYKGFTSNLDEVYSRKGIVMLLPSYSEGMNRALMEACATGKPIITTNVPGCREAVDDGKNGYLVPKKDAKALAEAMLKVIRLTPEEKLAFSQAGRRKAEKVFDVSHVIEVYDTIVSENK